MTDEFKQMVIDVLRRGEELPSEWARELFPPEKREYELVYYGKQREEDIIADTMALPLQPVSTFGKNGEDWHNMLIFGDNLQAMKTLLKMKEEGKLHNADGTDGFRLIYIDPPFATKKEFRGSQEQKAYQDKIAGAEFVEFIRKRLVFLKLLISSDGNIVVHLDNRKIHYVKIILDELLGEHNFVNEIVWNKGREGGSSRSHSQSSAMPTEYQNLLIYARDRGKRFWKPLLGPYKKSTVSRIEKDKKGWYYTRGRMGRQPAEWEIEAGVSLKTYVSNDIEKTKEEIIDQITAPSAEFVALGDVWNSELVKFTTCTDYPTEKPESLLKLIIKAGTKDGDLVLDCFPGSGTTLAVAEKMQRRWVGIDCGKLSIYTIQKRMLNLKNEIGNKGKPLKPKPFTLYNAGLYDFSSLRQLPWPDWRFFALQLFGCKDDPHMIGGLSLDGKLKGASVLVFNHVEQPGRRIDEETIQDIHLAVGKRIGRKFFIIAPRGVFDFQQDYIDLDGIRYYALRIPYSVINELHHRDFTALQQPNDESAVNDTVDAVGFDFIQPPQVKWNVSVKKRKGEMFDEACLKIKHFESRARIRGKDTRGGLETLSMLMLDFDYDGKVFDLDAVFYAHQLEADDWQAWFPTEKVGEKLMAVFIDIYGNEARELITPDTLGIRPKKSSKPKKKTRK
jgi:site-specific DNA-methyltransferase (adenine-specific)/adenine-specific DNA-methyltransferase